MPSSLAPSSFPATQQDPPARAQLLEDATASPQLLMSGATNPEGRTASIRDFDLNKEPYDPLPDAPPETSTILLSPDSSHVQANMDVEMETMGTTVMVYPSKITPLVDGYRSLEEKSADETLEAASGKKRRGSGTNSASDYISSEIADEIAMASSLKEKGTPPPQTKGRRCGKKSGPAWGWQCRNQAHPGYAVCLKHVISRRRLNKAKAEKKLMQDSAAAKSGLSASNIADAETSAKEKGAPPVPTNGRRCSRNNGHGNGWQCYNQAHPGYALCLTHNINRRNSRRKSRAKKLQARAESKTADADASTSATGGRKETGPSSSEPLVGAKCRKASARPMQFLPDKAGPAPVHERLEAPCIVINIVVVGSEQQRQ